MSACLFVSLGLAGCQKSHDFDRMQKEALAVVNVYAGQLEGLQRRAEALLQRGRALDPSTPGYAEAGRKLTEVRAQLEQLRAVTASAPTSFAAAAKTNVAEELERLSDETVEKVDHGIALVRAELDALESWLAAVGYARPPAAPAPASPEPVTGTPEVPVPTTGAPTPTGTPVPTPAAPTGTPAGAAPPAAKPEAPAAAPALPAGTPATRTPPAPTGGPAKPGTPLSQPGAPLPKRGPAAPKAATPAAGPGTR